MEVEVEVAQIMNKLLAFACAPILTLPFDEFFK